MSEKIRDKLFLVFVSGLVIRVLLGLYSAWDEQFYVYADLLFISGFNPVTYHTTLGPGFYFFFLPVYVPYLIANYFGFYPQFFLNFLFRIPLIIADIVTFYSLYNIGILISQDRKKSLCIASMYFLNPLVIMFCSVSGSSIDSLMIAFVALSFLYMLRGRIGFSAIFLSLSISLRFIPILLIPCYLAYLWHADKSIFPRVFTFLKAFSISLLAFLFIPYLSAVVPIYLASPSAFWHLINYNLGPGLTGGIWSKIVIGSAVSKFNFYYNFTSFIDALGLWQSLNTFLHGQFFLFLFVPLYLMITILIFLKKRPSALLINRYAIIVFSLLIITRPQSECHFFIWILPFLFIEALFASLPKHFLHVIWTFPLLIGVFFGWGPTLYWLHQTFPELINIVGNNQILSNQFLALSFSVGLGLFLVLAIIICLTSMLKGNVQTGVTLQNIVSDSPSGFSLLLMNWVFPLLLLLFCSFGILRISFEQSIKQYPDGPIAITIGLLGGKDMIGSSMLVLAIFSLVLLSFIYKNKVVISNFQPLLSTQLSKVISLIHILSIAVILLVIMIFRLDDPIFIFVQISVLGILWLLNKRFTVGLNLQRISSISTVIYISYILVSNILVTDLKGDIIEVNRNVNGLQYILYVLPSFLVSWLYLKFATERIQKGNMKLTKDFNVRIRFNWKNYQRWLKGICRPIFYISLISVVLLAVTPLMRSVRIREYGDLEFVFYADYTSSHGYVESTDSYIIVGNTSYAYNNSWATWTIYADMLPLMNSQMKNASNVFLLINEFTPVSALHPAEFKASHARIALNYRPVFDEELTFEKDGSFILSPSEYERWFGFGRGPYIKIPVDVNMLKAENLLNITLGKHASWKVERYLGIIISIEIHISKIHPPFWRSFTPYIFLAFALEVTVTLEILRKFYKWIAQSTNEVYLT